MDIKGNLHTFGLPEYGQLGHNTDGKYFINSNKMTFHFESSPKRIVLYIEKAKDGHVTPIDGVQIVDFSCGNNHTVRKRLGLPILRILLVLYEINHLRLQLIRRSVHTVGDSGVSVGLAMPNQRMTWYRA